MSAPDRTPPPPLPGPGEAITSLQNPRVKALVKLRDRRPRDEAGLFLVEGYRAIRRALDRGFRFREIFFCPEWFQGANEPALLREAAGTGALLVRLGREAFAKAAYRDRPEGLLAVASQWSTALEELPLREPPFLLVAEAIEKPGNLGTLLRSADAAGVDGVVLCDPVTDLFNPNVVRSSTGVLFSMPVARASTAEAIAFLKVRGIRMVATTPAAETLYTAADLTGPVALVMGSEQHGLGAGWLEAADLRVRIPMAGQADSLNVAMATLLTVFEVVRQRGG
ncbi:MAG: RNA methyltransferase [Puniceicoccaceae bacterium]|nr:MAG: RNA methyltransferase [Puniceicoccaceae bacterium]